MAYTVRQNNRNSVYAQQNELKHCSYGIKIAQHCSAPEQNDPGLVTVLDTYGCIELNVLN